MCFDSSSALPPLDGKCQEPDNVRGSDEEECRERRKFVSLEYMRPFRQHGFDSPAQTDRLMPCRCKVTVALSQPQHQWGFSKKKKKEKRKKNHAHKAFQGRWPEVQGTKNGSGRDEEDVSRK